MITKRTIVTVLFLSLVGYSVGFVSGFASTLSTPLITIQKLEPAPPTPPAPKWGATDLPNPILTPGLVDPNLSVADLCNPAYVQKTRTVVRTMSGYMVNQVHKNYGVTKDGGICGAGQGCRIDHLVPLILGGAHDLKNMWIQPYSGEWNSNKKDDLEDKLYTLVCTGKIELKQAQAEIQSNWITAYHKYITLK